MSEIITVASITTGPSGKKLAIKDTGGRDFSAWVNTNLSLQSGCTYEVEYCPETWKGRTDLIITKATVKSASPTPATNSHSNGFGNNIGAAVMGMVNQFISRGDVANDPESIAAQINKCLEGYRNSELCK